MKYFSNNAFYFYQYNKDSDGNYLENLKNQSLSQYKINETVKIESKQM
jgi:hypothetical protein